MNIFSSNRRKPSKPNGYSLVELLVVMAIISLLTTLSMTGLSSLMSSNHLNEGTAILEGRLELARQTARTLDRSVQLRLYQNLKDSSVASLQIVVPARNSTTETDQPIERTMSLPQNVIIADSSNDLSLTAFSGSGPTASPFNPSLPIQYSKCFILTFSPTGTITATDDSGNPLYPSAANGSVYWTLSLVSQTVYRAKGSGASANQMKNYATFYLNSVNGTFSCTRP